MSFTDVYCSQCLRIAVEGVTVDGSLALSRNQPLDFMSERRKFFRLYRGTRVLRKQLHVERRILNSLGIVLYCDLTKWIALNDVIPPCAHCRRIRRTHLTLDGLRLKRNHFFVNKNKEERLIYEYYGVRASRARRRSSFN